MQIGGIKKWTNGLYYENTNGLLLKADPLKKLQNIFSSNNNDEYIFYEAKGNFFGKSDG